MSKLHHKHSHRKHGEDRDTDGHHIESGAEEFLSRTQDAVRDGADHASQLDEDTLERGRVAVSSD